MKTLTIGMATYDDFHGVYFTIQALRLYHPIVETDQVEIIIIDNNPDSKHGEETKNFAGWGKNIKYIPFTEKKTTAVRNEIFKHAEGKYTICMDPHVLLPQGSVDALLNYYSLNPDCKNIVQGPMLYDNLKDISTSFEPKWNDGMYGVWSTEREEYERGEPFSIPMMGLGTFSCETKNWLGFNEDFTGFGGEEWYIHEKFRQNGGDAICLPNFKWMHRFGRPDGVKYRLKFEDRIWNYFIGWLELYDNVEHPMIISIYDHFRSKISTKVLNDVRSRAIKHHNKKRRG